MPDELAGSSEEELSGGEVEVQENPSRGEDRDLKDKLLRKYSGYLSSLKQEFSKKKKKGKLPKEARQTLLDWWNIHLKWPYPTVYSFRHYVISISILNSCFDHAQMTGRTHITL